MKIRIAINGFGRIGRVFFRQAFNHPSLEIVAINDPNPNECVAHLLKYDSTYGTWNHELGFDEKHVIVDGKKVKAYTELDPKNLPWKELKVDIVVEATGVFRTREKASWHLGAGSKRVLLTAPPKDEMDCMIVMGVNHKDFNPKKHFLVSNAS